MERKNFTSGQQTGLVIGVPLFVLTLTIGVPIAVLVVFFWLRALDLSFLATYRAFVLPLVVVAGVLLGCASGKLLGYGAVKMDEATKKRLEQMLGFPQPVFARIFLAVGIGIALISVPSAILKYWQVAGHTPLLLPLLTQSLLVVLWWTYIASDLITQNLVILRASHTLHQTAQSSA